MAKDVLITPLDGIIQFSGSDGAGTGQIKVDSNDLVISNLVGDVLLGDGDSDVFIGDGTNNVDIIFEQNGEIQDDGSGKNITLGSKTTNVFITGSDTIVIQQAGGNVGIGTTAAAEKLEVVGNISASGFVSASSFSGDGAGLSNVSATVGGNTFATDLKIGRDADNLIDFTTDNQIQIRVGASNELKLNTSTLFAGANDGLSLGAAAIGFSDLFLADGAVIGFNNGEIHLTQTNAVLVMSGSGATTLEVKGDITVDGNLSNVATTHITASGNISSSGIITAEGLVISDDATITDDLTVSGQIELGHASDTSLTRASAGDVNIEGNIIYRAGGTDVPVADGGTGASTLTNGGVLLGSGTGAITAMAVLTDGQMIVGDGTTDPVAESGATLRTSIGVGTGDNVQFTNITGTGNTVLGNATADTHTITGHITASGNISSSGFVSASSFSGDGAGITNVSATVADESITLAKLAHAAANTVMVRDANSAGDPSFKAVTNTQILIGDGTGFTAAALSGDVTMTNGGVVTIGANAVEGSMLNTNVAGTGLTVAGNNIDVDAAQTQITSVGTLDDLTVTGNITANGNIVGDDGTNITNIANISLDTITADANGNTQIGVGNTSIGFDVDGETRLTLGTTKITVGDTVTEGLFVDSHITASGNISASGTIISNDITAVAVTGVDSILNTGLKIGRDSTDLIDFATADNIIGFRVGNNDEMKLNTTSLQPATSNGLALGASNRQWSDLFLAEGAVINFDNGDVTLTQTADNLTIAGGSLSASGDFAVSGTATVTTNKFEKTSTTDAEHQGDVVFFGGTTSMDNGKIYHYKSDGTWELADADAVANCDGLLAVALGAASDTNGMLLRGTVTLDHDPGAVGDVLFLATGGTGQATATAPSGNTDIVRVVGYCLDASNGQIWFNPDNTFVEVSA